MIFGSGLIVFFQNCGKGFQAAPNNDLTSQCQAKIRASAPSLKLSASELNCADFNSYSCERRIFSPDLPELSESIKECMPGNQVCVDVEVHQFNTAGLRSADGPPNP